MQSVGAATFGLTGDEQIGFPRALASANLIQPRLLVAVSTHAAPSPV